MPDVPHPSASPNPPVAAHEARRRGEAQHPRRSVVVFAAHALPHVGGVEIYLDGLLRRLASRGWSIHLVTSDVGGGAPDERPDGIRITRLRSAPLMAARFPVPYPTLSLLRALLALRSSRPTAAITNTRFQPVSWLGAAFARSAGVPLLHIEHGSGHVPMPGRVASWISRALDRTAGRWVVRSAARSVGVSAACATFLRALGAEDPGILFSGVDLLDREAQLRRAWRDRLGVADDEVAILYVGRVTEDKGVPLLVEAFRRLPSRPRTRLVIAGAGNALERVRSDASALAGAHVLGPVAPSEVPGLLLASDVFAHPSLCAEGLPRSVLEAAAAGLPIVATPQGGTREVVRSEAEGVLVPPGDVEALASALSRLASVPELRAALGEAVRRGVSERFQWARIAAQAEALLLSLTGPELS